MALSGVGSTEASKCSLTILAFTSRHCTVASALILSNRSWNTHATAFVQICRAHVKRGKGRRRTVIMAMSMFMRMTLVMTKKKVLKASVSTRRRVSGRSHHSTPSCFWYSTISVPTFENMLKYCRGCQYRPLHNQVHIQKPDEKQKADGTYMTQVKK